MIFTELKKLLPEGVIFTFSVRMNNDGTQTVTTTITNDNEDSKVNDIPSLIIKGTAEELDADFLNAIIKPIEKTKGLISNIQFFESELERVKKTSTEELKKDTEKAAKQTKAAAKTATTVKTESKPVEVKKEEPKKEEVSKNQVDIFAAIAETPTQEEKVVVPPTEPDTTISDDEDEEAIPDDELPEDDEPIED